MASYLQSTISQGEKIIFQGQVSLWSLFIPIFFGFFFLFNLETIFISILCFVYVVVIYKTTEMAFTNKRLVAKTGFISRKTIEINLHRIESLQVEQGVFGRIFNFGSLVLSGAGAPQAPIKGIKNPLGFRNEFFKYVDSQKS